MKAGKKTKTADLWKIKKIKAIPKVCELTQATNYPESNFNLLVVDCEGCILLLLKQYPDMLNGIEKTIIENDTDDTTTKKYRTPSKHIKTVYPDSAQLLEQTFEEPKKMLL